MNARVKFDNVVKELYGIDGFDHIDYFLSSIGFLGFFDSMNDLQQEEFIYALSHITQMSLYDDDDGYSHGRRDGYEQGEKEGRLKALMTRIEDFEDNELFNRGVEIGQLIEKNKSQQIKGE